MQFSVIVSDDFLISLQGKFNIIGVYTGDIAIAADEIITQQLVFTFIMESSIDDVPSMITFEVSFPGEEARRMMCPLALPSSIPPERNKFVLRIPFAINNITLRPGRIEVKVIYEGGEVKATAPWIVRAVDLGSVRVASPTSSPPHS
jgi:hypothetical protein